MSAATTAPRRSSQPDDVGLRFPRLVRSEWIKFRSIRSTVWCLAILVVLTIAMAFLIGNALDVGGAVSKDSQNGTLVTINTASVSLTALVVAVLGVLIITGEYGTGQIRSTFTADPHRTGFRGAREPADRLGFVHSALERGDLAFGERRIGNDDAAPRGAR